MASVFTKIMNGELPGRFVYEDDHCFAILTIAPLKPGHTLLIPRQEVDHWIDLPAELSQHLFATAQHLAQAIQKAFSPVKVGLMIAGLEVSHTHLHLVPIGAVKDLDFERQDHSPNPNMMDNAAEKIRQALKELSD